MGHVFISAAHKSSGKTMVATGLARAFAARGLNVQPFKKGPDYIDPKWLGEAAGKPCFNLDFNTQSNEEILAFFAAKAQGADLSLIEGNKGLYDGVDIEGSDSNGALAKLLSAPVILVVDASGITRGVAPLLMGYRLFDPEVNIQGVILNKVLGPRHEDKLIKAIERYTDIEVLGAIKRDEHLGVDERHIGLIPSNEYPHARARIDLLARAVEEQVNVDRILAIANAAPPIAAPSSAPDNGQQMDVCIAVAKDAAFGFYYADDLEALKRAGARIIYFNALKDVYLPTCDGLFLGGGFPETQMDKLSANQTLRGRIKAAIEAGLPTYAECGGLMYLSRSIIWGDAQRDMVGIVPGDALMHPRPQGRGYVRLKATAAHPWPVQGSDAQGSLPAHEFHHSTLENLPGDLTFAYDVSRGRGVNGSQDGIVLYNLVAGYAHLRDTSRCRWAEPFTAFVRRLKHARNGAPSPAQVAG
ncbi:MAG: hydrogenobyrinic acid a,c-diamide synthase (glutamine-hydrolyzing) [Rhodospirillales bacterium]|nr:hydrogenobyrinic acid a,c-diamide synthase (glutamine-hydrolyzing) [Rhodospirillales bacterium]